MKPVIDEIQTTTADKFWSERAEELAIIAMNSPALRDDEGFDGQPQGDWREEAPEEEFTND